MVSLRHPAAPERIVVKSGPQRSVLRRRPCRCVVCGCDLRRGRAAGDLVCDSHPTTGGNPRADAPQVMRLTPDERLLVMLYRAAGKPLNVYRAFACDSSPTNWAAFRDMTRRLTASGLVRVKGHRHVGYKLASKPAPGEGTVVP